MGTSLITPSFTGGELAPVLYGRVDLDRYMNSLRTCRNFIAQQYGGARNRSGLKYVGDQYEHSTTSRLIPFQFSTTQNYALLFGDEYMLVVKDGGLVTNLTLTITGVTQANPGVLTYTGTDPANGDMMYVESVSGMTQLNGRFFKVANVNAGANTFQLTDMDGTNVNTTSYTAYSSGGTAERVYKLTTPYPSADLAELKYTQSADVMTLVHPDYHPRELTRTAHDAWTITEYDNEEGPFQEINTDTAQTVYASAATGSVTLTSAAGGPAFSASNIGQLIYIEQKDYGTPWETAKAVTSGTDIRRSDGKYYLAQDTATTGTLRPTHDADTWSDGGVDWLFLHPGFGVAEITAVAGATSATATVIKRIPDAAVGAGGATYKWAFGAWGGDQGYPSAVAYHQQRQVFAGTPAQPQTLWMTRTGAYNDFGKSVPSQDDDAITMTIASRQVNAIRHLMPLDQLIIFTSGSEWIVRGVDDVISVSTISAKVQGYRGSSHVPPLVVGNTALFLQEKGAIVRDLGYEFSSDTYTGNDLIVLASHLFFNKQITDWAYQQVPNSNAWCVRSDGTLLGLTYMREQKVVGWHRHDTDGGLFESICSITEGSEDVVYALVKRTIGGVTRRYIERFASRDFDDIKDAYFVDCGLTYDGRNTGATTMTVTTGTTYAYGETLTLTASAGYFVAGDVGKEIHLDDPDSDAILRIEITGYTSNLIVTGIANRDVSSGLQNTATTDWGKAQATFTGMWQLEGESVTVLADGHVDGPFTVTSGSITIQNAATVVHAGLAIESDLETLDVNVPNNETVRDKQKIVPAVRFIVESSRSLFAGPDEDHLTEFKQRSTEHYDQPVTMLTGVADIRVMSNWNKNGRVFVRQSDPLPLNILAVIPEFVFGGP